MRNMASVHCSPNRSGLDSILRDTASCYVDMIGFVGGGR